MNTTDRSTEDRRTSAFDIRVVIAAMLGLFGVIILFMGIFGTTQSDLDRADGTNVNLWTGAGLLVATAILVLWARLRPVEPVEPDRPDEQDGSGRPSE